MFDDLHSIPLLELTLRLLVASVFFLAGAAKLADTTKLAQDIASYRIIPQPWINRLSPFLPPLEIMLGLLLLLNIWTSMIAIVVVFLLLMFIAAALSAIARKLNISCGCYGLLYREQLSRAVVVRDSVLMLSAAYVVHFDGERLDGFALVRGPMELSGVVALVLSLSVVVGIGIVIQRGVLRVVRQ